MDDGSAGTYDAAFLFLFAGMRSNAYPGPPRSRPTGLPGRPSIDSRTLRSFPNYAQFDDKMYVIVGTLRYDRLPTIDRSGPEIARLGVEQRARRELACR